MPPDSPDFPYFQDDLSLFQADLSADHATEDLVFDLDDEGHPCAVRFSSGWRKRIPASALGLALTAELSRLEAGRLAAGTPVERIGRGRQWTTAEQSLAMMEELLVVQRTLGDHVRAIAEADDVLALGIQVPSRNRRVVATILGERIVHLHVDPAWVERVAISEVSAAIDDCLERAGTKLRSEERTQGSDADMRRSLNRLVALAKEMSR
jgi:hypothetical protein